MTNLFIDYGPALGQPAPDTWLLQVGTMGVLIIIFVGFFLWRWEKKDQARRKLYVPVTPIAREYQDLFERIRNAKSKAELKTLEQVCIYFKLSYELHEAGNDLSERLFEELRAKRYFLTLNANSSLQKVK